MAAPLAEANTTVTAAVRRILIQNSNKALRLTTVFEQIKPLFPDLSRTHFREKVVRQMFDRGELVKYLVTEEVRGRARQVYGMRLKNNRDARERAQSLGLELHKGGWTPTPVESSSVKEGAAAASSANKSAAVSELR